MKQLLSRPRKTGLTLATCVMMAPTLTKGQSIFIAGAEYPENYVNILNSMYIDVYVEECYIEPRGPFFDNLFAIEPEIIGFTQKPKKLTGYILKARIPDKEKYE